MHTVIIRKELHPLKKDAYVYRAYFEDGTPLYLGRESLDELKFYLQTYEPEVNIIVTEGN